MRHRNRGRKLSRDMEHRWALYRNLASSLFAHERIITTVAKAKELRPFAERLITIAKRGSQSLSSADGESAEAKAARAHALAQRRRLMALLGGKRTVIVGKDEVNIVDKLLKEIGPRFKDRAGGYTRVVKRVERRVGDAAPTAFIELLKAGEKKEKKGGKKSKDDPSPATTEEQAASSIPAPE